MAIFSHFEQGLGTWFFTLWTPFFFFWQYFLIYLSYDHNFFFERTQHQLNLQVSTQNIQFGCVENILRPSESKKSWRNANIFICWAESRTPIFYPVDSIFSFVNIFWYTCPVTITFFSSVHNINGTYKILTIKISESVLSKKLMSWGQIQYIRKITKRQKRSPQDKKSGSGTLLKMWKCCHFSMTFSIRRNVENFLRVQTGCYGYLK